ncbi:MAG: UbiA prenyltransferase family protein [Bacilli bacterium]|nr:UbiA prenyltransferase family protein [Bacilli bacterium]
MKKYIKLIRVKHWIKNLLVFLPIFFSINIFNMDLLKISFLAFVVFCCTSSIVYIINDMSDIEKDRLHPIKKLRPLASGEVSKKQARIVLVILGIIVISLMAYFYIKLKNIGVFLIPIIYIVLNILYSKGLKNIPIIDIVILVSGFVFRVMYGGVVTDIEVSKYLYLMIIFGAFYLGFGKRRNEIIKNGNKSRKVLSLYSKDFLDKNMYVMVGLAIVSYTLWTVDAATIARVGNDYLFWTIPLLIVTLLLYSLNIEGNSHGDPIEVILSNKLLIGTCLFYGVVMFIILYII